MSRRHHDATDRLAAALAEQHPSGWDLAATQRPDGPLPRASHAVDAEWDAEVDEAWDDECDEKLDEELDNRPGGHRRSSADRFGPGDPSGPRDRDPSGRSRRTRSTRPAARTGRHARVGAVDAPAWLRVPAGVSGSRVAPIRRALLAVIAVLFALVAVFGVRLVRAQEPGEPVAPATNSADPETNRQGESASAEAASGPVVGGQLGVAGGSAAPLTPGTSEASAEVVVHVVGQVRHPGVVDLPSGSRVADAIKRAGGARSGADLAAVNLARLVVDGEQIFVPKPGQSLPAQPPGGASSVPTAGGPGGAGSSGGGLMVNINTADLAGLDALPGVGPVLAGRILAWRTEHGRFTAIDELGEVSGIGEKLLAQLRPLVTL